MERSSAGPRVARRIAIIGNAGGGKSSLARQLGRSLELPVHHVDSIQFQPGWQRTPRGECDLRLDSIARTEKWVIDGFGSDESIERRLRAADTIVFIDFPLASLLVGCQAPVACPPWPTTRAA